MLRQWFWLRTFCICLLVTVLMLAGGRPAQAAKDTYVTQYLRVTEPVALKQEATGQTQLFSYEDMVAGKRLFEENCKNCHLGGATLPNPLVPLSLPALQGATPPRDNITNLVAYLRQPMLYDGSEVSDVCRQVPENWLSQSQVENLSAFILRAAEKAPGWGTSEF